MEGVERAMRVSVPYKLASREYHPNDTLVALNGSKAGANKVLVIAGPCAVESREQVIEVACMVKEAGATSLRGGAYKPRTFALQLSGTREEGLKWLVEARERTGLPIVTK